MALVVPKIQYPSGTTANAFTFTYPPRRLPYATYEASRHDNISSAGVKEAIHERTDVFLNIEIEQTPTSNMAAWDSFIKSAITGTPFDYFPDSTGTANAKYTLEDQTWTAAYKSLGMFSFTMKFRRDIGWP